MIFIYPWAISDYKKTQKALATCQFCYGEDDSPPKAAVISMATRCYLACPLTEDLIEGHCYIVPIQPHLSMLEGDDDVWDEVRVCSFLKSFSFSLHDYLINHQSDNETIQNFMKCLMQMFAEEDKGVVFYETVISIKWQKHTMIECVPLPWDQFEDLPAYFKVTYSFLFL